MNLRRDYPCVEFTADVPEPPPLRRGAKTMRIWVASTALDLKYGIAVCQQILSEDHGVERMCELACNRIPHLNAVQCMWTDGYGIRRGLMVYTVPFCEVHRENLGSSPEQAG